MTPLISSHAAALGALSLLYVGGGDSAFPVSSHIVCGQQFCGDFARPRLPPRRKHGATPPLSMRAQTADPSHPHRSTFVPSWGVNHLRPSHAFIYFHFMLFARSPFLSPTDLAAWRPSFPSIGVDRDA